MVNEGMFEFSAVNFEFYASHYRSRHSKDISVYTQRDIFKIYLENTVYLGG